jgi:hypothetical protein
MAIDLDAPLEVTLRARRAAEVYPFGRCDPLA